MISAEELTIIICYISTIISQGKSVDELALLAAIFTQIGSELATIGIKKDIIEKCLNTALEKKVPQKDTPLST